VALNGQLPLQTLRAVADRWLTISRESPLNDGVYISGSPSAWESSPYLQPPPLFEFSMIPEIKAASSKPSFRWPWSKKRKAGDQSVARQPDLEDQVPTQQVDREESNPGRVPPVPMGPVQVTSPIVVASNAPTTSGSGERRLEDPTSGEANSNLSTSGLKITPVETPCLFPNASHFVVHGLQANAHQHGSTSNDPSGAVLIYNANLSLELN
jgi:hypothetical protein